MSGNFFYHIMGNEVLRVGGRRGCKNNMTCGKKCSSIHALSVVRSAVFGRASNFLYLFRADKAYGVGGDAEPFTRKAESLLGGCLDVHTGDIKLKSRCDIFSHFFNMW